MSLRVGVVEGWTGPLAFQLLAAGVPANLTGQTVTMSVRDKALQPVTGFTVAVVSPTDGRVSVEPPAGLLRSSSPYTVRFKVTDAQNRHVFFPSDEPDTWIVRL